MSDSDKVDPDIWAAGRRMLEEDARRARDGWARPGLVGEPLVTIDSPPRQLLDEKAAGLLVGMIFLSASEGDPHVVTIRREEGFPPVVTCICKAMRSIDKRPSGCWGIRAARAVVGIHEP